MSSAFNVLERVIHGDDDELEEPEEDGRADTISRNSTEGNAVESRSTRPSWVSDGVTEQHASSVKGRSDSGSGNSVETAHINHDSANSGATKPSSSLEERRGSWFQGMFRSKKDKEKEANMGKELEAYFDKQLGRWVFPDQEGNGDDEDGGGMDAPPMNFPQMNAPPMSATPPEETPTASPLVMAANSSTMGTRQNVPALGVPMGPPLGSQQSASAKPSARPRRRPRYASFGMPVIASDPTVSEDSSLGTSSSNRPETSKAGPQIPGVF